MNGERIPENGKQLRREEKQLPGLRSWVLPDKTTQSKGENQTCSHHTPWADSQAAARGGLGPVQPRWEQQPLSRTQFSVKSSVHTDCTDCILLGTPASCTAPERYNLQLPNTQRAETGLHCVTGMHPGRGRTPFSTRPSLIGTPVICKNSQPDQETALAARRCHLAG